MTGSCMIQNIVEADGSVYPCDFYCLDEWKLGNILEDDFPALMQKQKAGEFIEVSLHKPAACAACQWYNLCRGGCRRDWEPMAAGRAPENYFCSAYQEFFAYAAPRMREMAYVLSRGQRR